MKGGLVKSAVIFTISIDLLGHLRISYVKKWPCGYVASWSAVTTLGQGRWNSAPQRAPMAPLRGAAPTLLCTMYYNRARTGVCCSSFQVRVGLLV